jgi:uncharacterized protein
VVQLRSFDTAKAFLMDVERDLARNEVEHHLLLGAAHSLIADKVDPRPMTLAAVRDDDGLALAALMAPPFPMVLANDRAAAPAAIDCLVQWLHAREINPRRIFVGASNAGVFSDAWRRATGISPEVRMRQRQYALRAVVPVHFPAGSLRTAEARDLDRLEQWMGEFNAEAMRESNEPALRERIQRRVAAGEVHLWDDGEPRSMAGSARPTRRGIAINAVYTPPEWRGRGYATSCVAKLSELLLSQGREFCVLYTDLANPTSNSIYTRIGYRPVADFTMLGIDAPEGGAT